MKKEQKIMAMIERITEGKWFEVDPYAIDRSLFEKEREDPEQEKTRQLILEAFVEFDANPEKYSGKFEIMVPNTTWKLRKCWGTDWYGDNDRTTILTKIVLGEDIEALACVLGDRIADWVEQALAWAQRICNGETWKDLCNTVEKTYYNYRVIVWKNNLLRLVGNATRDFCSRGYRPCPATYIWDCIEYSSGSTMNNIEPVVVRYKK